MQVENFRQESVSERWGTLLDMDADEGNTNIIDECESRFSP